MTWFWAPSQTAHKAEEISRQPVPEAATAAILLVCRNKLASLRTTDKVLAPQKIWIPSMPWKRSRRTLRSLLKPRFLPRGACSG